MILSVSRRTDIPAWYFKWFMGRLKENYLLTANPYNAKSIKKIPFTPETVECIVFWSKNPAPALKHLHTITEEGYKYYFQFTLTPYGKELETNLPDKKTLIKTFHQTAKYAPVVWRYDPIIITPDFDVKQHIAFFEQMAKALNGATDRCIISFVETYPKLETLFKKQNIATPSESEMITLATELPQIANLYGMELRICCPQKDFSGYGLLPSACIDAEMIENIIGRPVDKTPDKGQRQNCRCISSIDVGSYNTCPSGCIYCYANSSYKRSAGFLKAHDQTLPLLATHLPDGCMIKPICTTNQSLF